MEVFVAPRRDETGKFQGIVEAFPYLWRGHVLDVGSRSGRMRDVIHAVVESGWDYYGLDLLPPADVLASLEKGLPFTDGAFDLVLALDVLEHTDNIHSSFAELCRVSSRFIVITLPNVYELKGRVKFLRGRPLSGKYGLPVVPPKDRHRWIFSFRAAQKFVHHMSSNYGFIVRSDGCLLGPRRKPWRFLISRFPDLLAPTYLALLEKSGLERR